MTELDERQTEEGGAHCDVQMKVEKVEDDEAGENTSQEFVRFRPLVTTRGCRRQGRYLVGVPILCGRCKHGNGLTIDVRVDSDWANGTGRKSTRGGLAMTSGTVVELWSRTQATRALSVPDSDYHVIIAGTAQGFGMQHLMDLGRPRT